MTETLICPRAIHGDIVKTLEALADRSESLRLNRVYMPMVSATIFNAAVVRLVRSGVCWIGSDLLEQCYKAYKDMYSDD